MSACMTISAGRRGIAEFIFGSPASAGKCNHAAEKQGLPVFRSAA
jgi:hypothetical protein